MSRLLARVLTTLGVLLAVAVPGMAPAGAVAHGTAAAPGQFAFAVKLTMTGIPRTDGTTYDSACSAALISRTWIMTAGHCFHDAAGRRVSGPVPQRAHEPWQTAATRASNSSTVCASPS
jgi:hypothetical protein